MMPNEAMHRMSGHHVSSRLGRLGWPLIGDLDLALFDRYGAQRPNTES